MKRTRAATWRTAAALGMTVFVGGTCFAQVNQTPLAIPAGGTQGQASLYPSTLTATYDKNPATDSGVIQVFFEHVLQRDEDVPLSTTVSSVAEEVSAELLRRFR